MVSEIERNKANYTLNKVDMLRELKSKIKVLENITLNGIMTPEEHRLARVACSVLVSDFYFEDALMADKTGEG